MVLEVDVVEFRDATIPYDPIMLNTRFIRQIEPVGKKHQDAYAKGREIAIEKRVTNPEVLVSDVLELPKQGALIFMDDRSSYYTVTPFKEIQDTIKRAQLNNHSAM